MQLLFVNFVSGFKFLSLDTKILKIMYNYQPKIILLCEMRTIGKISGFLTKTIISVNIKTLKINYLQFSCNNISL